MRRENTLGLTERDDLHTVHSPAAPDAVINTLAWTEEEINSAREMKAVVAARDSSLTNQARRSLETT